MKTKLLSSLFAAALLFSTNSFADMCYEGQNGQSEQNVNDTTQMYKDNEDIKGTFMACATTFLDAMSPEDVVNEACPNGHKPCDEAVKEYCRKDHDGDMRGKHGVSDGLCEPFRFMF